MKKLFALILLAATMIPTTVFAQTTWQSELVRVDADGRITYNPCPHGFIIPDFSQVGYMSGNADIPDYRPTGARLITVTPIAGCNRARIQTAIDSIGRLTPDANGMRGVVLLAPGRFETTGQINVNRAGVVLRGRGMGPDRPTDSLTANNLDTMSMIFRNNVTNASGMNVVVMGPTSAGTPSWTSGTNRTNITTPIVRVGDFSFNVESTAGYSVGDNISVLYPVNQAVLASIWYGGNSNWVVHDRTDGQWVPSNMGGGFIPFHRYITAINGNTITVDAPIYYVLDRSISQPHIIRITRTTNTNIGVEDLRISMNRMPSDTPGSPADHNGIRMNALENSWVQRVHVSDFIHAGIKTEGTTRSTIRNVRSVDCAGGQLGGNWYNINNAGRSQQILIQDVLMRNGRHHWISNGGASVSGIVVHRCRSTSAFAASEGHRYLSQGILIDNWQEVDWTFSNDAHRIGFFLRDNMGSGHGWGAAFSVLWNCNIQNGSVYLDRIHGGDRTVAGRIVTAQNYSIGGRARTIRKFRRNDPLYEVGYVEGNNRAGLYPESLFEAQLRARNLGTNPNVPVTSVSLNKPTMRIMAGARETLTATILPETATNRSITWTSSNTAVATVNADGVVTAVSAGSATITATATGTTITASCAITVVAPISDEAIRIAYATSATVHNPTARGSIGIIAAGDRGVFYIQNAAGAPSVDGSWFSVDAEIPVRGRYRVEFIYKGGAGRATVQPFIGHNPDITVNVSTVPANALGTPFSMITPAPTEAANVSTLLGSTATLSGTVRGDTLYYHRVLATGRDLRRGTNTFMTLVTSGGGNWTHLPVELILTLETVLCDVCGNPENECTCSTDIPVTAVTLNKSALTIMSGATETLVASITPSNATNRTVTWSSNNAAATTVSTTGLITAVAPGTATITATTADGARTAQVEVTVVAATAENAIRAVYATSASARNASVRGGGIDEEGNPVEVAIVNSSDGGVFYVQTMSTNGTWFSIDADIPARGQYKVEFIYKTGTGRGTVQAYMGTSSELQPIGSPINMRSTAPAAETAINVSTLIGAAPTRNSHYYQVVVAPSVELRSGTHTFRTTVVENGGNWAHLPVQVVITQLSVTPNVCPLCDELEEECVCEICLRCGNKEPECTCIFCPVCDELIDECTCPNSIRNRRQTDNRHGILLENAIVSDLARISVITPAPAMVNLRILDNLGNVVWTADGVGAYCIRPATMHVGGDLGVCNTPLQNNAIVWNLTNPAGRFVANGTYLVIAEATEIVSGRIYVYYTKIGVRR